MAKRKVGASTIVESEPTWAGLEKKTVTINESLGKGFTEDWTTGEGVDTGVAASEDAVAPVDVSEEVNTGVVANPGTATPAEVAEGRELGPTAFWLLLAEAGYEAW